MAGRALTVVQLLPALEGGGVERGTLEVAAELVRRGHRALVISAGGRLTEALRAAGAEHIAWPIGAKSPAALRWVRPLRALLHREGVDILHARSRLPAWIGWLAWRGMDPRTRPRLVTTVHGLYRVNAYSAVMTRGERVIAVSEAARDYLVAGYRVAPERIRVIPRGVDRGEWPYGYRPPPEWLARWRAGPAPPAGARVLTLPGRLTRLKGHEDFLDLLVRLQDAGHAVHGLIVGGTEGRRARYAAALARAARARGLDGAVTFLGHRADVREIYAVSDLVLSLSRRPESFGRTVLEALSLGVPVAGYDHGGVGEILARVYPAGRVPAGDLAALAATVGTLLRAPPPVPREHPYTLGRMLADTLDLYVQSAPGGAHA